MAYDKEEFDDGKGRPRHGSPEFYKLLDEAAKLHDRKSHDYASNEDPFGNYKFAGQMALMFKHSSDDAGFVGRLAEKIYRLANLESSGKTPKNENIQDTELDIIVIVALWMAARSDKRNKKNQIIPGLPEQILKASFIPEKVCIECGTKFIGPPSELYITTRDVNNQVVYFCNPMHKEQYIKRHCAIGFHYKASDNWLREN